MSTLQEGSETYSTGRKCSTLLKVAEAIVAHRDLDTLFHDLAGRLHLVVRFDYLACVLHDATSNTMRLHVLETTEPISIETLPPYVEDDPAGNVLQTQHPLIVSNVAEESRWPQFRELMMQLGVSSLCEMPLTTARRRLGVLAFACKQAGVYDAADVDFLQQVAKQVAVAVENAVAFDEIEALQEKLKMEKVYLEEEIRTEHNFEEIVGNSAALRRVLQEVETVAPTDSTVLIRGETGTGKELVARAIHHLNDRREPPRSSTSTAPPFPRASWRASCSVTKKAAFTGAIGQKVGRFELAHQGTLFLDEVGDIPPELQPKLLRVLQEQEFERLGGTRTIKVNVRLVAATHRDLEQMVVAGQFRSDLYYRLNVFPVLLPPLRERRDDIPQLVRHFVQKFARQMGRRIETIPAAVMDALVGYPWPGNIREMQNVIERAVILSLGTELRMNVGDLKVAVPAELSPARRSPWPTPSGNTSRSSSAKPAGCWVARRGPRPGWGSSASTLHGKIRETRHLSARVSAVRPRACRPFGAHGAGGSHSPRGPSTISVPQVLGGQAVATTKRNQSPAWHGLCFSSVASGGIYSSGPTKAFDFQEPYLGTVLGFIGITNVDVVRVEGVAMGAVGAEKAIGAAMEQSLQVLAHVA